jgi:glycosyltransferase involved in cell wall biosynthesis
MKTKLLRIATVPISLDYLLKGQLRFLNQHFEVVAVSGEDAHLRTVAEREQVRVVPLPMQRAIRPFHDLVTLWRLYWLFRTERPQIVHSITPKAGLLSMMAAKMAGVPIRMHTFTGLIFPSKKGFMQCLLIKMDQLLCWTATNIYPEGNGVKQDLIHFGITSKPLKVLANGNVNGIDLDYFSSDQVLTEQQITIKQQLGIEPNDFVYVFVGRLVGDKGINELVEAFGRLEIRNQKLGIGEEGSELDKQLTTISNFQSPISSCKLLLVGPLETDLDPLLPETLKNIEENPNIIAVGYQNDVRPYFAISNALVFPSYREGFPNVVLQAGAMGLPSIVTNINGCNEIIEEGINGLIIPPKDSMALQNAMICLLEDKNVYKTLKNNARQMITSRYEQKLVWEALLSEYQDLLVGSKI